MIKKEEFTRLIDAIEKQCNYDKEYGEKLSQTLGFGDNVIYNNQILIDSIVNYLVSQFLDKEFTEAMINNFLWDYEFGKHGHVKSASDLYDTLFYDARNEVGKKKLLENDFDEFIKDLEFEKKSQDIFKKALVGLSKNQLKERESIGKLILQVFDFKESCMNSSKEQNAYKLQEFIDDVSKNFNISKIGGTEIKSKRQEHQTQHMYNLISDVRQWNARWMAYGSDSTYSQPDNVANFMRKLSKKYNVTPNTNDRD